mmetsp:Transcript_13448/g.18394  ORF Transcript_13448/g.18394 Transcript_13448/m.18394 type:complete len:91 (+) Transcript_13448:1903-2175(+)
MPIDFFVAYRIFLHTAAAERIFIAVISRNGREILLARGRPCAFLLADACLLAREYLVQGPREISRALVSYILFEMGGLLMLELRLVVFVD